MRHYEYEDFRVHFSISCTLHSRVHFSINCTLHSRVYFNINFTLHSRVHFSISCTLHFRVNFSIIFTLHSRVHFSIIYIKIRNCKRICQNQRDWTISYRGIVLFPFYSNLCSVNFNYQTQPYIIDPFLTPTCQFLNTN